MKRMGGTLFEGDCRISLWAKEASGGSGRRPFFLIIRCVSVCVCVCVSMATGRRPSRVGRGTRWSKKERKDPQTWSPASASQQAPLITVPDKTAGARGLSTRRSRAILFPAIRSAIGRWLKPLLLPCCLPATQLLLFQPLISPAAGSSATLWRRYQLAAAVAVLCGRVYHVSPEEGDAVLDWRAV